MVTRCGCCWFTPVQTTLYHCILIRLSLVTVPSVETFGVEAQMRGTRYEELELSFDTSPPLPRPAYQPRTPTIRLRNTGVARVQPVSDAQGEVKKEVFTVAGLGALQFV